MISTELLRRYPFFSGFTHDNLLKLAGAGTEMQVDSGHYFFHEGTELDRFFLLVEGAVNIIMELPVQNVVHPVSGQMTGQLATQDVVVTNVGPGDIFGWSGLVPPHAATSGARATAPCRVVAFDCPTLLQAFEADCRFGYLMLQKIVQVTRARLQDLRVESLAVMP